MHSVGTFFLLVLGYRASNRLLSLPALLRYLLFGYIFIALVCLLGFSRFPGMQEIKSNPAFLIVDFGWR